MAIVDFDALPDLQEHPSAYYVRLSDTEFQPTLNTQGAWNPHEQHMAPVSGLVAHALTRHEPRPEMQLARVTYEILGMIPALPTSVQVRTVRPGRTIEMIEAVAIAARSPAAGLETGEEDERDDERQGVGRRHAAVCRDRPDRDHDAREEAANREADVAQRPEEAKPQLPLTGRTDRGDEGRVGAPEGRLSEAEEEGGDDGLRVGRHREHDDIAHGESDIGAEDDPLGPDPVNDRPDDEHEREGHDRRQRQDRADLGEGEVGRLEQVEHRDRHVDAAAEGVDADRRDEPSMRPHGGEPQPRDESGGRHGGQACQQMRPTFTFKTVV